MASPRAAQQVKPVRREPRNRRTLLSGDDLLPERTFGVLLEKKRRELSLSRQALADRLGVSPSHIAWLERGNRAPSLTMFQRLADALNLDAQQIFLLVRPAAARFLLES